MSLFDIVSGAMGRPDPTAQLAAQFDPRMQTAQALAGQQGGPQAGPGGPPSGGGAPGAPPTGAPPAGPQGAVQAPPQPQAYQSPPDLMQAYMTLMQRSRAEDQFNRGLALMAASAYPGRRPDIIMNSIPQAQNTGQMFDTLMKMQQWNYLQQQQAAFARAAPQLAKQLNMSPEEIMAMGPEGMRSIVTSLAGVSGDATVQAMMRDKRAWQQAHQTGTDANGNPTYDAPMPDKYGNVEIYRADTQATATEANQRTKDLEADRQNFQPALDAYDRAIADLEKLKASPGLPDMLGTVGQYKQAGLPGLSTDTSNAIALYNKIMGSQYAAGVQDFKGAGRITQQELKQDLPSQSTMPNRNVDVGSFTQAINDYEDKLRTKRAQIFGQAGQLANPALSDSDYGKVADIYKPGGTLYVQSQPQRQAARETAAQPTQGAVVAAPAEAVSYLKAHPELAAQFDAKYGAGASKQILGQ